MNVLVPFDGSDPAKKALELAIERFGDENIVLLNVVPPNIAVGPSLNYPASSIDEMKPAGGLDTFVREGLEAEEAASYELLEDAKATAAAHGVDVEIDVWFGRVSDAIIEFAEAHDIDHIIMGSHGRTGPTRILLGSVAQKVAERSPTPVTIAR